MSKPVFITTEESQAEVGAFEMTGRFFMIAGTYWINGDYSILEAEAPALLEAIKEAYNMSLDPIILRQRIEKNNFI
ncbi:hypothetical protein TSUD_130690 [Trifolium subterraneum]|jgi:hypothetical protein|nr:hypothetical protein TSUD_130690 [Trifolium subterraneum]